MVFQHKNVRLPAAHYVGRRWYFITFCCENRLPVFNDPEHAVWLIEIIRRESATNHFAIHAYCVMADHFHFLALGVEETSNLLAFVKLLKQKSAFEFKKKCNRALWQKKSYDHILRAKDSVESVAAYIWMNPVRKGLCVNPGDYSFSGSFTMDWKECIHSGDPWIPPWKATTPA